MKTLNNLRDASTIFLLSAAFVLFLTSCEKEELSQLNSLQSDQAVTPHSEAVLENTDLAYGRFLNELMKNDIARQSATQNDANGSNDVSRSSFSNDDNAHTGQKPYRIATDKRYAPIVVPTPNRQIDLQNDGNAQTDFSKQAQYPIDINSNRDLLEPFQQATHK